VTLEGVLYASLFGLAFALRFWDLGTRALHHDESIHAQWSWNLLRGDYTHSPIFHGPLYYHVQGFAFLLFGASDYTARLTAALFGMFLVGMPLLLRRQLGTVGTVAAVALIAFSPTLVYYSRFFREDIYVAVFVLGMVVAIARYLDEGRDVWLVVLGLSFTGAVLSKEGAFLTTAVFLLFLDVHLAADLAAAMVPRQPERPAVPFTADLVPSGMERAGPSPGEAPGLRRRRAAVALAVAPVAWVLAALWPFVVRLRERVGMPETLPRSGALLLLLGTFTLPLLTPALAAVAPGRRHRGVGGFPSAVVHVDALPGCVRRVELASEALGCHFRRGCPGLPDHDDVAVDESERPHQRALGLHRLLGYTAG
jgi:hypothetical protein